MRFLRSKQTAGRHNRGLTVSSEPGRRSKTRKRPASTAQQRRSAKKAGRSRAPALLSRRQALRLALSLCLLLMLSGTAWLWQSGWFHYQTARLVESGYRLTAEAGLKVEDLQVTGRQRTGADAILAAMDIEKGLPILRLDPESVRTKLLALPWVKDAEVSRQLPDTVALHLTERQPLAVWQLKGKFSLIDGDGKVIPGMDVRPFAKLPLVVGDGAQQEAPRLLAMLRNEPALSRRVTAAVWVGSRRWQLQLDGGIDVHLPESDPAAAWTQLASMEREHGLLDRGVLTIDLRLPDRLLVRTAPTDEGAANRKDKGENT